MSGYRDDLHALRQRVAQLEQELRQRHAELHSTQAALATRNAEIERQRTLLQQWEAWERRARAQAATPVATGPQPAPAQPGGMRPCRRCGWMLEPSGNKCEMCGEPA